MNIKILGLIALLSLSLTVVLFAITGGDNRPEVQVIDPDDQPTFGEGNDTPTPTQPVGQAQITGKICETDLNTNDNGFVIVAERMPEKERFTQYRSDSMNNELVYNISVEPGSYQIYTEDYSRNKIGLYSEYVVCKRDRDICLRHNLKQFTVNDGQQITNIDICDYDWAK